MRGCPPMPKEQRTSRESLAKTKHQLDSTTGVRLDNAGGGSRNKSRAGPRGFDEQGRNSCGNPPAGPGHQPCANANQPCERGDCPEVVSVAHRTLDTGRIGDRKRCADRREPEEVSRRWFGEESVMVRHASHFDGFDTIIRANRTILLGLLWGGMIGCVVAASVYDIGRWVNLW
jgi:hypothetical protein